MFERVFWIDNVIVILLFDIVKADQYYPPNRKRMLAMDANSLRKQVLMFISTLWL